MDAWIDQQTDQQMGELRDKRQANGLMDGQTDEQTIRQIKPPTHRLMDGHLGRGMDGRTHKYI